jgi:hypothetical protein
VAAATLGVLTGVVAACGSSNTTNAAPSAAATKAAFCADNVRLDKAFPSVTTSPSQVLAVLKANQATINDMAKHYPSGAIGSESREDVNASLSAIATNNIAPVVSPTVMKDGADLDTYCGVDTNGNPLPAYFGQGKGNGFCNAYAAIETGLLHAPNSAAAISFLKLDQADVNVFNSGIPSLPSAVQTDAQTLQSAANAALSANNSSPLLTPAVVNAATRVDLYCGVNH